ncbi:MAG: hypothetical protein K2X93_16645 [Candidatus Obscuribacterales bacterium]|nr:hypothetical protein [Candidatus Obscuribacterales bacterium]
MKSKENKKTQSSKNPRNQRKVQDEMQALEGMEAFAKGKVKPKPESAVDIKTYNSIPRNKQGEQLTLLHGWEELLEPPRSYKERIDFSSGYLSIKQLLEITNQPFDIINVAHGLANR